MWCFSCGHTIGSGICCRPFSSLDVSVCPQVCEQRWETRFQFFPWSPGPVLEGAADALVCPRRAWAEGRREDAPFILVGCLRPSPFPPEAAPSFREIGEPPQQLDRMAEIGAQA